MVEIGRRACPVPVIGRVEPLPTTTARREEEGGGHRGEHTGIGREVGGGAGVHHPLPGGCLQPHGLELMHERGLVP